MQFLVGTSGYSKIVSTRSQSAANHHRQLARRIEKLNAQRWKTLHVFFKHEDTGTGPQLAARLPKLSGVVNGPLRSHGGFAVHVQPQNCKTVSNQLRR